ncbi:MAG: serine protease [Bacteroidales bacterium]|nr:serine protease [Bacteroidales bacterium]
MGIVISLIIIGLLLVFAEVLIIPGVGVAGILGIAAMAGSCVYAFMEMSQTAGIIVTAVNAVLLVLITVWVLRAKTWQRLALQTNIDSKAIVPEADVVPGTIGITVTRLAPMGTARFGDLRLEVTAREGIIDPGVEVEVVEVDGIKVYVAALTSNVIE